MCLCKSPQWVVAACSSTFQGTIVEALRLLMKVHLQWVSADWMLGPTKLPNT